MKRIIQNYYYDYKTDWDFKVYYGDLKITYTDISGTNNVATFPLYVEYYNNAADYYDYSLGSQSSSNKNNFKNPKYNAPIEAVIFREKELERLK